MIVGGAAFAEGGTGARDLKEMLESMRPAECDQMVIVDTGVREDALQVLADESAYRAEQGLATIEVPKFKWIDDFAAARNYSFSFIKTAFWLWADSDDLVEYPQGLRELIQETLETPGGSEVGGFWLPYRYAFDEYGNATTLHDRERLMKTSVGWSWDRRIHETCAPSRATVWATDQRTIMNHYRGHDNHSERNLKLLLRMHEEEPEDLRVWRDLGNQYYSNNEWEKAVEWYEQVAVNQSVPMERWQAMCYAANAYRELGRLKDALRMDNVAILTIPDWNVPYYGMAQTYALMEEWEKAKWWALESRSKGIPNRILFVSPLDAMTKAADVLLVVHTQLGDYKAALAECDTYLEYRPKDERILEQKKIIAAAQVEKDTREDFLAASRLLTDSEVVNLRHRLDGVLEHPQARNVWVPALLREARRGTQPEVVFFCGPSLYPWRPGTPEEIGVGGSETAAIEIARRFANDGYRTIVYNDCGGEEGVYDGVHYVDFNRFRVDDNPDIFVSWRQAAMGNDPQLKAGQKLLWNHNLYVGGLDARSAGGFDKILALTEFHKEAMKQVYPFLKKATFGLAPNGINLDRFHPEVMPERQPHKVVYFSSPDRGLYELLQMWPEVTKRITDAELHVFYGFDNLDKSIARGDKGAAEVRDKIMSVSMQPNVQWRGKISQTELAKELLSAQMWAYPATWYEEFCIAALEAMAAGLYIVTSDRGALPEVLGPVGDRVGVTNRLHPGTKKWQKIFTGLIFNGLLNTEEKGINRESGPARAALFTWDASYEAWKSLVEQPVAV